VTRWHWQFGPIGGLAIVLAGISGSVASEVSLTGTAKETDAPAPNSIFLAQSQSRGIMADPVDGRAWAQHGDQLTAQGQYEEALAAYRRAENLGATNEQLTIAKGDALKALGKKREAYYEFASLYDSPNPDTRETACQQMQYLGPFRYKQLPDPYFGDLYAQTGWQSIGDTAFIDSEARLGANPMPEEQLQLYAIARLTRDNRSGLVGNFPQEYFDNVGLLGIGVRAKPWTELPLYLFAEAGRARDLIDLNRDRNRSDTRGGIQYYQEWFTERACTGGVRYPSRFVMAASAEAVYYSRYDDAILSSMDIRPGIRLMESNFSSVDLSLVGSIYTNSKADDFVQFTQAGVALTWVPDARNDLKIVVEQTRTFFTNDGAENNFSIYSVYAVHF
jgi:tetratricopeptide (TPR) repeat protein